MDIFEYAMDLEEEGRKYYLELADQAPHQGMKRIFERLAEDEQKHYNVIKEMEKEHPPVEETEVLRESKNIFTEMKEEGDYPDFDQSHADLYRKALKIEEKSRDFYLEKSGEVEDAGQKEIFQKLAEEEKKHYFLLDNLIEFVTRPDTWLEDAEFFHLDEY